MRTTFVSLACCAVLSMLGAGCDPWWNHYTPPGGEGNTGSSGVQGANVSNCSANSAGGSRQFTVFKMHEMDGWLWGDEFDPQISEERCNSGPLFVRFDQPGTWRVRAKVVSLDPNNQCDSSKGEEANCLPGDYLDFGPYTQDPEGPITTITLQ